MHQRMAGRVKMLACMPVGRRIATADVSARKTKPQMYPRLAKLHAVLAIVYGRVENAGLAQVRATRGHDRTPRIGARRRARIKVALALKRYSDSDAPMPQPLPPRRLPTPRA